MEPFLVPNLPFFLPLGSRPAIPRYGYPRFDGPSKKVLPADAAAATTTKSGQQLCFFIDTKLAPSGLDYIISPEGLGQLFCGDSDS